MSYKLKIKRIIKKIKNIFSKNIKKTHFKKTTLEDFKKTILEKNEKKAILLLKDSTFDPSFENDWSLTRAATLNLYDLTEALLKDDRCKINNCFIFSNAVYKNNINIVKLLLSDKRTVPSQEDNWAIQVASINGYHEIVEILLKDNRINPAAQNNYSIQASTQGGYDKITSLLLSDERIDPTVNNSHVIIDAYDKKYFRCVELLWNDQRVKDGLKKDDLKFHNFLSKKILKNKLNNF
jgi:hypothetical protein